MIRNKVVPRNLKQIGVLIVKKYIYYTIKKKSDYLIWLFSRHSRTREDSSAMYVLSDVPLNPVMPLATKNLKK